MNAARRQFRCSAPAAAIVLLAMAAALVWPHAPASARRGADAEPVAAPRAGGVVHPLLLRVSGRAGDGSPLFTNEVPHGYAPIEVRRYLGLEGDGEGETIGIVSAFRHPAIRADLDAFSLTWGLPLTCGAEYADPADCITLTDIADPATPVDGGWALETALDVEWAHAIAPRADIVLVQAADAELPTMMRGISRAIRAGATVVSNSWGDVESRTQRRYDFICRSLRAVCVFASGNSGHGVYYPATAASGIAVGGTSLSIDFAGNVRGETAWSGSGGGLSEIERRPRHQDGLVPGRRRGVPDVSYAADPTMGFAAYSSVPYEGQDGWFAVGGTSVATPQWAGIIAAANGLRVAAGKGRLHGAGEQAGGALYALRGSGALFDVTAGSNGTCGPMCDAAAGYDLVTGLGSPRRGIDAALAAAEPR